MDLRDFLHSKFFIVLVVACLVSAVMLGVSLFSPRGNSPASDVISTILSPIQGLMTAAANHLDSFIGYFTEVDALRAENAKLKEQIFAMEQSVRDAQIEHSENVRLREMLDLKQRNRSFTFEMAEVVGAGAGDWETILTIDKGSLSGIEKNNCVITSAGMVGFVSSVGPNSAEITTVTDVSMQAGALLTRSREAAVAEGDFELMKDGVLKLSYLKKDCDIVVGDTVETSGLGGIYPKGILIGTVIEIKPETNGISNYAVIEPAAELGDLTTVFIVKDFEITE